MSTYCNPGEAKRVCNISVWVCLCVGRCVLSLISHFTSVSTLSDSRNRVDSVCWQGSLLFRSYKYQQSQEWSAVLLKRTGGPKSCTHHRITEKRTNIWVQTPQHTVNVKGTIFKSLSVAIVHAHMLTICTKLKTCDIKLHRFISENTLFKKS